MGSGLVIVVEIRTKNTAQRDFVEHDQMVQALAPNRTNHALDIGSLPGGARCGQHLMDSHVSYLSAEFIPEDGIAIAQQVARELVKREPFPQLLSCPFRGRMGGHVEVDNATPVVGQHQKYVQDLETESGHRKEIDRDQLLEVIVQEGAPGLRGRLAAAHHVLAHAALPDVEAEFDQLPVDAGCTPTGIFPAHPADQVSNRAGNERSSGLARSHLPGPEPAKAGTMPGNDGFRLDDGQCRTPIAPDAEQTDPKHAIRWGQLRAFSRGPLKDADLVAQSQILQLEGSARTKDRG